MPKGKQIWSTKDTRIEASGREVGRVIDPKEKRSDDRIAVQIADKVYLVHSDKVPTLGKSAVIRMAVKRESVWL